MNGNNTATHSNSSGVDISTFDAAVSLALDPTPAQSQNEASVHAHRRADEYLRQFSAQPDSWSMALRVIGETKQSASKFVALQTIEAFLRSPGYLTQSDAVRAELRRCVFSWIQTVISHGLGNEPAYVRNKLAVVLAWIIKRDYPERWTSAFGDILQLARVVSDESGVDLCLRVLSAVETEVVRQNIHRPEEENTHNGIIKDTMRATPAISQIAEFWYSVLLTKDSKPELATLCLQTMEHYIEWIDVNLIANDRMMPMLLSSLTNSNLRTAACACLYEICDKGMPNEQRLQLYHSLNICDVILSVNIDVTDEDDLQFAADLAELLSLVGRNSIQASERLSTTDSPPALIEAAQKLVVSSVEGGIKYLGWTRGGWLVGNEIMSLIDDILWHIKHELQSSSNKQFTMAGIRLAPYLEPLASSIATRYKYPENHVFDKEDEEYAEFELFRNRLKKAFTNAVRAAPQVCLNLIRSLLSDRLSSLASLKFSEAELMLSLVYHLGDGCPSIATELNPGKPIFEIVCAIHRAQPWEHEHHTVLLAYYELTARYALIFCEVPGLLPPVLSAMTGSAGLKHPQQSVRSRCIYLLLKLVKALCKQCGKVCVAPVAMALLNSLEPFLSLRLDEINTSNRLLSRGDQQYVFEIVGVLLGQHWVQIQEKQEYLNAVLSPLLSQILSGLEAASRPDFFVHSDQADSSNSTGITEQLFEEWLQQSLSAVAHITKGFHCVTEHPSLVSLFEQSVSVAARALATLPKSSVIRNKLLFLLHRMVSCLDRHLLNLLVDIFPILLATNSAQDLCDLVLLMNQMLVRFRADMIPFTTQVVGPLTQRISEVLPAESAPQSDLATERRDLQNHFFLVVHHVMANGCADALSTDQNLPLLWQILDSTEHALVHVPDITVTKYALQILSCAVDSYLPAPANQNNIAVSGNSGQKKLLGGEETSKSTRATTPAAAFQSRALTGQARDNFIQFIIQRVARSSVAFALAPHFDLRDQACHQAIKEAVILQALCAERCGSTPGTDGRGVDGSLFLSALAKNALPSLRCDRAASYEYSEQLRCALGNPARQAKPHLRNLIRHLRSQEGMPVA